jgi:hypothetical protein
MTDAYAVITPDGELSWYPLNRSAEVEALVGGPVAPGALDTVTVAPARIPGRGPLKCITSDIGALFPDDYPVNPLAGRVLMILSGGRYDPASWHGTVALTEYEADPVTREVLWPGEMSPRWVDVITAAVSRAREALSGNPAPEGRQ